VIAGTDFARLRLRWTDLVRQWLRAARATRAANLLRQRCYHRAVKGIPARAILLTLLLPPASFAADPPIEHSLPIRTLVHYVDWHGKCPPGPDCGNWQRATTIPFRRDARPGLGYRSDDPTIIREHNREMWEHRLVPLVSWWGPTEESPNLGGDSFLDLYLSLWDERYPVRIGLLYEVAVRLKVVNDVVDFSDAENAERFVADLRHLQRKYWSRFPERFHRLHGRPLLFIWLTHAFRGPFDEVAARARAEAPVFLIGSDFNMYDYFRPGLESTVRGLDAVSSYSIYSPLLVRRYGGEVGDAHVRAYAENALTWSTWLAEHAPQTKLLLPLSFAFDDTLWLPPRNNPVLSCSNEAAEKLADTARALVVASRADCGNILPYVLFVSYNEHYEGTAIEPNDVHGWDFLEIVARTFAPPVHQPAECLVNW
jgi:hypothetical protein